MIGKYDDMKFYIGLTRFGCLDMTFFVLKFFFDNFSLLCSLELLWCCVIRSLCLKMMAVAINMHWEILAV